MAKRKKRGTPHERKFTCWCEWCGEPFDSSRDSAITDTPVCRQRRAAFIKRFGYMLDEPPGQVTASKAGDDEVDRLIQNEAERRRTANELIDVPARKFRDTTLPGRE